MSETEQTRFNAERDAETVALVSRCLGGDSRAWNQLIDRYSRLVHSVPVRYGLSTAEADDVGQEVFLALAQSLHTIDAPERLPAWLLTTARRITWRAVQRRKAEYPLDDEPDNPETGPANHTLLTTPSMETLLHGWQLQTSLRDGLLKLGDRCRELITTIFLDPSEPSYDEISARLGLPKGSIGPTRNRCLQQLRSILEGLGFAAD